MLDKEVNLSAFIGAFTHEVLTNLMSSCVSFEIIDNELVMFLKIPVAGKGVLSATTSINLNSFETNDVREVGKEILERIYAIVTAASIGEECETTVLSSSEN